MEGGFDDLEVRRIWIFWNLGVSLQAETVNGHPLTLKQKGMAILLQGILGPFSGKVGPVVGCICRRKGFYVRSLPAHYHDARTPAQLRNRARMKGVMEFLSVAKVFVNHTFGGETGQMTATNVATRLNFHKVEVGEDYAARVKYGEVVLSRGALSGLADCVCLVQRGSVVLGWNGMASVERGGAEDVVDVLVYDETRHSGRSFLGIAKRGEGGCVLSVPERWVGDALHVYVAVEGGEEGVFSESQYFGFGGERRYSATTGEGVCFEREQSAIKEVSGMGMKGEDWGEERVDLEGMEERFGGSEAEGEAEGPPR